MAHQIEREATAAGIGGQRTVRHVERPRLHDPAQKPVQHEAVERERNALERVDLFPERILRCFRHGPAGGGAISPPPCCCAILPATSCWIWPSAAWTLPGARNSMSLMRIFSIRFIIVFSPSILILNSSGKICERICSACTVLATSCCSAARVAGL